MLCNDMNIEPDSLKPKTIQDIKEQIVKQRETTKNNLLVKNKAPGNVGLDDDKLAETRLSHYNKRRAQALVIIQLRLQEKQSRNNETPS